MISCEELPPQKRGKARVLVFGDLHFKAKTANDNKTFATGLVRYARACGDLDAIVCLGDVLDGHQTINLYALNRAVRMFDALCRIAPVFVLVGNHDRGTNLEFLNDESPFLGLKYMPNFHLIDDGVATHAFGGVNCLFVPYVFPGRFAEAVAAVNLGSVSVVFAHQEFRGAITAEFNRSVDGDSWARNAPLVISGHFHEQQTVGPGIIYVGAAFQQSKTEDTHKGFSIFDFDDNGYEWWFIEGVVEPTLEFRITPDELAMFSPPEKGRTRVIIEYTEDTRLCLAENDERIRALKRLGAEVVPVKIDSIAQRVLPGFVHERGAFDRLIAKSLEPHPKLWELLREATGEMV